MKYLVIAILFTAIGYGLALLLSGPESSLEGEATLGAGLAHDASAATLPEDLNPAETDTLIAKVLDPDVESESRSESEQSATLIAAALDAGAPAAQTLNLAQQQADQAVTSLQSWDEGTYLIETDLLLMPGIPKMVGFRIGPPVPPNEANVILDAVPVELAPAKVRFLSANDSARVLIVAGQFTDLDQAYSERRSIQTTLNKSINFIYLPDCLLKPNLDEEGYACGLPLSL